jgi:hypothetical protein
VSAVGDQPKWVFGELLKDAAIRICQDCGDISLEDEMHLCKPASDEREGLREPTKEELAQALRNYPTWGHAMVAAQDRAEQLTQDYNRIVTLLKELKAYEYPQGPNSHPTRRGQQLWGKVDKEIGSD